MQHTIDFLAHASHTGVLGSGPRESAPNPSAFRVFFVTLPWFKLLFQVAWSLIVIYISTEWHPHINVPTSVISSVGWALTALLGFFIRDTSKRYRRVSELMLLTGNYLRHSMTTIVNACAPGTWHPGDIDRIVRHFIAFPIALKMSLRGERERAQLEPILHPRDVDDVINAHSMHLHCTRVIRAYVLSMQENSLTAFKYSDTEKTPCGGITIWSLVDRFDNIDFLAQELVMLSEYRPSIAYLNHLKIFLYIWMTFLPLSLVQTSGWYTVFLAMLVTHGIGMLYNIALALNDPFGFDIHDVRLNRMSAKNALLLGKIYQADQLGNEHLVDPEHDTPAWLEESDRECSHTGFNAIPAQEPSASVLNPQKLVQMQKAVAYPTLAFVAWCAFIVFYTWGVRERPKDLLTRWWFVNIPMNGSTESYVGLGIFLLLSFWLNDAYGRHWRGIELWQTAIPSSIDDICMQVPFIWRPGLWHQRDHERFFSFLAALPFVAKQALRDSNNFSELDEMLSPKDIIFIKKSIKPVETVLLVLRGYMYAADSMIKLRIDPDVKASVVAVNNVYQALNSLENSFVECHFIREVPIPPAFTSHLHLFAIFWLSLLPLTIVLDDGFVSFVYLVPIGYSIINLLVIGREMSDPFGTDEHDLPMDLFCKELRSKVQAAYSDMRGGLVTYVKNTGYERSKFKPVRLSASMATEYSSPVQSGPTLVKSLKRIFNHFPKISPFPVLMSLIWSTFAVFLSRWLSYTWGKQLRESCPKWCSPIDVSGSIIGDIGFALFLILGFRCSDGLSRYDKGGEVLNQLSLHLRDVTLDFVTYHEDGEFHPGDKERMVAHIAQIPLCLRDMMLGKDDHGTQQDTLLNEVDYDRYKSAASPIEYLLQTIGAYLSAIDVPFKDEVMKNGRPGHAAMILKFSLQNARKLISKVVLVKRFPVIHSYTNHQHLFTILWLLILPFSMTSETGFFTILWCPLISYVVLSLESIALKLVDPYGEDDIDLPVDDICRKASSDIVRLALTVNWGTSLVLPSPVDSSAEVAAEIRGNRLLLGRVLPQLHEVDNHQEYSQYAEDWNNTSKPKPTLYAHMIQSVPWWALLIVTVWTVLALVISYISRDRRLDGIVDWWEPEFTISSSVSTNLSVAAFTLLGFYINNSMSMYNNAGDVWGCDLRKACHITAHFFLSVLPRDRLHQGDHERVIGHIAALPVILKAELRGERDIRGVNGLLSFADIGRIQSAPSMSRYCLDVLYSYYAAYMGRAVTEKHDLLQNGLRTVMTRAELLELEQAVRKANFVKDFPISSGFVAILDSFIGLFFLVLPFVLASSSGWLSILWIVLVAYGVLGIYKVAGELQDPYGSDLNDLDLDTLADKIMREIISVFREQRDGYASLIKEEESAPFWSETKDKKKRISVNIFREQDSMSKLQQLRQSLQLAFSGVPLSLICACTTWAVIALALTYFSSVYFPQNSGDKNCPLWRCSVIAIDSSIASYIGWSLFLALVFFLGDSHGRYENGFRRWRNDIMRKVRIVTNRMFQSFYKGYWHRDDFERIAGHLSASVLALKAELRGKSSIDGLSHVLSESDVNRVKRSADKVNYCNDVIRSYRIYAEQVDSGEVARQPVPFMDMLSLALGTRTLGDPAFQCRRIVCIPLPFGYVQHLRIFLAIWVVLLPLTMVETTGWMSLAVIPIICYGVIGVERWAHQLSDPFGNDVTDLPLDEMANDICDEVQRNLQLYKHGVEFYIQRDRVMNCNNLTKAFSEEGSNLISSSDTVKETKIGYGSIL